MQIYEYRIIHAIKTVFKCRYSFNKNEWVNLTESLFEETYSGSSILLQNDSIWWVTGGIISNSHMIGTDREGDQLFDTYLKTDLYCSIYEYKLNDWDS